MSTRSQQVTPDYDTSQVERRYDAEADRLFLVYYALPPGFNRSNWGVSPTSIDTNIHSAVNKPVVIYRRNPNNRFHTHQAGSFVHPTLEEAEAELGHPPNLEQYFNWQEKFAVGRVRSVDKRDKGYSFTLEITDNDAKQILKSDDYKTGIPGWTSPQIISNAGAFPEEERTNYFNHWVISHIALVDVPAYGYEQAGVRGKCLGAEKDCMIRTRSASEENLGFCVKQATIDLVQSRQKHATANVLRGLSATFNSSQSSPVATAVNITMSESQNTSQPTASGQTVTFTTPTVATSTNTQPYGQTKASTEPEQPEPVKPENENQPDKEETEPLATAKSLDEANTQIKQMHELLKELQKSDKSKTKELETLKLERKQARLSYIIPRDLFKSDESHFKEVQKTMNENISEQWLAEYWKTKRELAMAQSTKRIEEPLVAKSASLQSGHDVPDFNSSQNTAGPSILQKQLELQRRILDGGGV